MRSDPRDEPTIDSGRLQTLLGASPAMQEVRREITFAGRCWVPVLITGEPGVGRSRAARLLHSYRTGEHAPLLTVACGESSDEVFRNALSQVAAGGRGTIFLTDLGAMSATRQELLLKALESTKEGSCIIASGPSDLLERVASSWFSERLFYRLNTVHIVIPPLRARQDDVPDLVRYFLGTYSAEGAEPPQLSLAAHRCLVHHAWPGNVGQLKRVVQRLTQPGLGRIVRPADLPRGVRLQSA